MNTEILDELEQSIEELFLPVVKPLMELLSPMEGDPNELLKSRFLCRGGAMTLVGPTGIGKSTLAMQLAIRWSLGQSCFEIGPARRLKILHIQAENDEGDLAEMRDGIITRLALTDEDKCILAENYQTVMVDSQSGLEFCEKILRPLIRKFRPDLVILDPALAYLGGDTNNQQQVGEFLRSGLNPILHEFNCALLLVHHTNKPPSGSQKPDWTANDFAYLGSGSAEWANWARAVIAIRSIDSSEVFELRLGKRGKRVGWHDDAGVTTLTRMIRHSRTSGQLFWDEVTPEEALVIKALEAKSKGKKAELHPSTVVSYVPEAGTIAKSELEEALQTANYPVRPIRDKIKLLVDRGDLVEVKVPRAGARPSIHLQRPVSSGLVTITERRCL